LRASFSNSTTTPRHEAFQAVSGGMNISLLFLESFRDTSGGMSLRDC
jgi:hypothetical protein